MWALARQRKRQNGGLPSPNDVESSSTIHNINSSPIPHIEMDSNVNPVGETSDDRPESESTSLENEIEAPCHNQVTTSQESDVIEISSDKLAIAIPCAPPHNQGFSHKRQ